MEVPAACPAVFVYNQTIKGLLNIASGQRGCDYTIKGLGV